MNTRLQLQKLGAGTAGAVMLWAVAVTQSSVAAAGPVTIGSVQGAFYPNPTNIGAFDPSVLTSPAAFTQQFPVIAFNPPIGAVSCSNITSADVNLFSRPLTDVVSNPDGTCSLAPAMGNGFQAGIDPLFNFQVVFTADLNVASAGQLTLNVSSDDGFVLGIGPRGTNQPTRISGTLVNPPISGTSFVKGYPVMGALNQGTAPSPNDITIDFPVAGTYPLELDYTECCAGFLSLTFSFNGTIVPPAPPSTHTTALTYTGDLAADFNDPAHLSATLQDTSVTPAAPVSNEAVTLNLGGQPVIIRPRRASPETQRSRRAAPPLPLWSRWKRRVSLIPAPSTWPTVVRQCCRHPAGGRHSPGYWPLHRLHSRKRRYRPGLHGHHKFVGNRRVHDRYRAATRTREYRGQLRL